jgi:hypothetical protein
VESELGNVETIADYLNYQAGRNACEHSSVEQAAIVAILLKII